MEEMESDYYCSPEWHLARLSDSEGRKQPFAALLYPFAHRLSKKSKRFHASAGRIAKHFGVSRWTVLRSVDALVAAGFFEAISKEKFQPSVYRVVPHVEWAKTHPGCCAVRETMPWTGEPGDELGVQLYNASGGKVKYQPHKLTALRNTGFGDDDIVRLFEHFVGVEDARRTDGHWHGRWRAVPYRFLKWLKGSLPVSELGRLGLGPSAETTLTGLRASDRAKTREICAPPGN